VLKSRGSALTGKHNREVGPAQGSRLQLNPSYRQRYWQDANLDAVVELEEIAGLAGIKPVALAYRWLAAQETVDSIVVGASRPKQLQENLSLWDGDLSADTLEACDRVWAKLSGPSYPYNR
jgi:aryl-alcohol dehydrogenase-like predicted oxidoreductase